jgi:hypothetical protein
MKKYYFMLFSAIAICLSIWSCKKENIDDEQIKTKRVSEKMSYKTEDNTLNVIVEDKLYKLEFEYDEETDNLRFLNCPIQIENYFLENEKTIIPHIVISEESVYCFYYKNEEDFSKHVIFQNSLEKYGKNESVNGLQVTQWEHGKRNFQGYGNNISELNTKYQSFQPIHSIPAIYAYGKESNWVGHAMNDKISVIDFYLKNGDEPGTYIGYEHSWPEGCGSCKFNTRKIIITKLKALGTNGTWVGQNSAGLWAIKMNWIKTWNDKISGYQFFQSPVTINTGVSIR